MADSKQAKSPLGCKVILLQRRHGQMRFGILAPGRGGGFAPMPFPDLLAMDQALEAFASGELGLGHPEVHGRFVERPLPDGMLYYLVEERAREKSPARDIEWLDARAAAERLEGEDRGALARAMGYLSGQRFAGGRR